MSGMPVTDASTVRAQLDRILASSVFLNSPRMTRFLKFVVEETLAGTGERIKEYVVALEVFDKSPDFDPQTDSSVRTEAGKLRARLNRYYDTEGQEDPVVISIPKGSYLAAFVDREHGNDAGVAPAQDSGTAEAATAPKKWRWRRAGVTAAGLVILCAAAGLSLRRRSDNPAPRVVPLTAFAGDENYPSFSPDGNQVVFAFSPGNDDNWNLYVKMIGSATALRLTTTAATDLCPAWSPDGRQIAFLKKGKGIYLISPLGGQEQKIAEFSATWARPSWSPDGKFLVVPKSPDGGKSEAGAGALYLVPVQGGEPRLLLTPPPGRWYTDPALAPNGRSLAFASCGGAADEEVCYVSVVGLTADFSPHGSIRQLSPATAETLGLTWTADGRSLLFSAGGSWGEAFLWRVDAAAGGEPKRLEVASQGAWSPAVSRIGNRLAFSRFMSDADVWRLQAGGKPEPLLVSSMLDQNAQFSPDGRRIAFESGRGLDGIGIWLANADGSGLVQLTKGPEKHHASPSWSPDGQWIAFNARAEDGRSNIKVVESSGGQTRQLTSGPFDNSVPSWSRDGKRIYFTSNRTGRFEIWRMPSRGGPAEQITHEGGYKAIESLDATTLYYTKGGGDGPLYARPLEGGEEKEVLRDVAYRGFDVFEDGIYYISHGRPLRCEIRFHNFVTGRSRVISELVWPSLGLSVSPDRKTFLYSLWAPVGSDLMLIENFQ
jgi:Tol biopolymer transport system component